MAETKETPQNYPEWDCQLTSLATQNKAPNTVASNTVGTLMELRCEGETINLVEPLKIKPAKGQEYILKLLEPLEISENHILYLATGYRAGEYQGSFRIEDSAGKSFMTSPLQVKVESVLDPSKPDQKPFGPIAPMTLDWPVWIFFTAAVVAVVLLGWFLIFFRQWNQRRTLEKNIKKFQSPLGSYHQFSKDIRLLKRSVVFSERQQWPQELVEHYLNTLEESFKLYILREYVIPATSWSSAKVFSELKRKDRRNFYKYRESLNRAFKELERAKSSIDSVTSKDCEQLTQICRKAVDGMWQSERRKQA